jgi:HSP20 family protein
MAKDGKKNDTAVAVVKPKRELQEMGQYFEDVFGRPFLPAIWSSFGGEDRVWAPSIDVIEMDDKFVVKAELPGVKEEDINVSISGNMLTVEGEKQSETEEKKDGYHYSEASYGSFSRSITIPSTVDTSKIEASCDKGVLEIILPKMAAAKPKKIAVAKKKAESSKKIDTQKK